MSASMNFQHCCWNVILLDVPGSANTAFQAISRTYRLGQRHEQRVWIVTVDETYDRVIQSRAAKKMVSQIAGQANLTADDEEIAAQLEAADGDMEVARIHVIEEKASALYQKIFGQFDSRLDWGDVRNLKAIRVQRHRIPRLKTNRKTWKWFRATDRPARPVDNMGHFNHMHGELIYDWIDSDRRTACVSVWACMMPDKTSGQQSLWCL